jgi:hypothetical protein
MNRPLFFLSSAAFAGDDAPGGDSTSHMRRHIGLAWLALPLSAPVD